MMTLRYSQQDARLWAAFSGDYNPVHFDKAWVKSQGKPAQRARYARPAGCQTVHQSGSSPLILSEVYRAVAQAAVAGYHLPSDVRSQQACFSLRVRSYRSNGLPFMCYRAG